MDIIVRNYEETFEEILVDYDKGSFFENWQENETWEVGFSVLKTQRNEPVFDQLDYESTIIFDGEEFVVKGMTTSGVGAQALKNITATHVYYTVQDGYQYETETGTRTIKQLLTFIFKNDSRGFSWKVEDPNNHFLSVEQENFGNANYLKLIQEILADYGAVVIANNRRLTFYPKEDYGQETETQIRYKYNTDDVKFDIDTYDLKTQIKGFGKKKEDDENAYVFEPIVYTSSQAKKWGIRIQDPVEDERYTIEGNMKERLKRDLHDYPSISGSIAVKWGLDLKKGDKVPFIYEPLQINTYIQVVGIKKYPAIPNKPPEITLSNTKKTMTSILAGLAKKGVVR